MIRIDIISAVPKLLASPLEHSIVGRARQKKLVDVYIHDLREYSTDKHKKVDDYMYGGGAGMILTPQPIFDCIRNLKKERRYDAVVFPTPDAVSYKQKDANAFSVKDNLIILCGHYKGVDQRVRDELITHEFNFGDFVLSGGELPALTLIDSIVRLLPGALGDSESAMCDSFQNGMLEGPVFTRPANYEGLAVPDVLQSGNHKKIEEWRYEQSLKRTRQIRPELDKNLEKQNISKQNNE